MKEQDKELLKKALCMYLPYKLNFKGDGSMIYTLVSLNTNGLEFSMYDGNHHKSCFLSEINPKPILRPLSDLTKEIEHNGEIIIPLIELAKIALPSEAELGEFYVVNNGYVMSHGGITFGYTNEGFYISDKDYHEQCNQLELFDKLHEWHFDTKGLIEKGLAIDLNTLKD